MPLLQTSASATARASGFARNALIKIYDLFNRVTSGSLGTTTSGSLWHSVTGIWSSNSGVAQTASSPSSYPMATVVYGPNATLTLQNITPGSGLCFWESDTGDWWGSVATPVEVQVQTGTGESFSSCCSGSNTCVYGACCSQTNTCPEGGFVESCTGGLQCVGIGGCPGYNATITCVPSSCCSGSNTCLSGDCISYPIYTSFYNFILQILQSIAGTVSIVTSAILAQLTVSGGVNGIQSLSMTMTGENVTATGYSDPDMADPLGSVSAAAGSVPTATGVGIMLVAVDSSASAIQGDTVGAFTAI